MKPLPDVTHEAIRVLTREIGVVDTARFLSQYGAGRGDYTRDRHEWLGDLTLEEIIEEARRIEKERGL